MTPRVKICGITNTADGLMAAEAGADAVGFVFYERSPRAISPEQAATIIKALPPDLIKVGVFVDPDADLVMRAIHDAGINVLQFHGNESPEFCLGFGVMTMKAFRVRGRETLGSLPAYGTDAWLLDAYSAGQAGGTGETFDWDLAAEAVGMGRPVFLAGGLGPANVAEAIRKVQPFGVDVSSGVESSPGRKDETRVREFVKAAKNSVPA